MPRASRRPATAQSPLLLLVVAMALSACSASVGPGGASSETPDGSSSDVPPAPPAPELPCQSLRDCGSGRTCVFPQGCGMVRGVCRDLVDCAFARPFCACDGTTFRDCTPSHPYVHEGACDDPNVCRSAADCSAGTVCVFEEGVCTGTGTCQMRGCTRDLGPYCGCDGRTFQASSTCPDAPFRFRGPCETFDAGVDGGR